MFFTPVGTITRREAIYQGEGGGGLFPVLLDRSVNVLMCQLESSKK